MNLFEIMTGKVSRMSHVNRYSSHAVIRRENVAEHSWWVSFIALLIGLDLLEQGQKVSIDRLLQRAVCHDLSEVLSGDIIRSYKHGHPDILRATKIADQYGMTEEWGPDEGFDVEGVLGAWWNSKREDLEGDIVRFADMAAVAFYCAAEAELGNEKLAHVVLKELYNTWLHSFHFHRTLDQYADQIFPNRNYGDALRWGKQVPRIPEPRPRPLWGHGEGATSSHDWSGTEVRSDSV